MTEPRNAALIAAVDPNKPRLLRDEAIPTEQSPHCPKLILIEPRARYQADIDWGGLLSAGCSKFHTRKMESIEAHTKRNTGMIQDAQRWNDSKRHVVGFQQEEFDVRHRSLRVSSARHAAIVQ
jgi:hypothetical protein